MNWLETAKSLPAGRTIRVQHCGADNSMLVSHTATGYSAHCFRCGEHPYEPHGKRSISDILRHKAELQVQYSKEPYLPKDYTHVIPPHAAVWFMQYGISPELASRHGIGWSDQYQRVVLPVYDREDKSKLIAVQMRAVEPDRKPKYLNPGGAAIRRALFWVEHPVIDGSATIVVEDILSAIKLGRKYPTVSTLGTTMTDERAVEIAKQTSAAVLWLDNDRAGHKGMREAHRQLAFQGVRCWKVLSERDPKTYSQQEIENHLRRMQPC